MVKANIFKPVFIALIFCVLMMVMLPPATVAQNVKIISASPGDTVSLPGTGNPNSQIKLEVSATINVGTTQSGSTYRYKSTMNGLHIPDGNSMSITVSPVDTLTVSGSIMGYRVIHGR